MPRLHRFLFDGSTALLHRWQGSNRHGAGLGRVAPQSEWPGLRTRLPEVLATNAKPLPTAQLPQMNALLAARHSSRAYSDAPVSARQLGGWLAAGYGVRTGSPQAAADEPAPRTVPSGGALYPLELTLILRRPADDFAPGVYRVQYDAQGQVGLQAVESDLALLDNAYSQVPKLMNAAGVVVISGDLFRSARKYRNMALTLGLLEAGCVLQNLGLAAHEAGLGWTAVNGFDSKLLGQLCRLDPSQLLLTSGFFGLSATAAPDLQQREMDTIG